MYVRINNNSPSGDRVCSGHRIQSSGAGIYKPSGRRSDRGDRSAGHRLDRICGYYASVYDILWKGNVSDDSIGCNFEDDL